jgi:hypothetical protein
VRDALKTSSFGRVLSEVFEDIGLLFQQEMKLAKTEVSHIVAEQVRAILYFMVAGLFSLVALLLLCQAAVFFLINAGVAAPAACLIVAAAAVLVALIAFVVARSNLARAPVPTRAMNQLKQDIATAKESLS